jgi:IS5 family transposase
MQQWFTPTDPGMEEAFFNTPSFREFAQLEEFGRLPYESTILRFRHRLEKYKLADKILAVVDATLTAAPSSTRNKLDFTRFNRHLLGSKLNVCFEATN